MKTIERYVISALMRDMRYQGYNVAAVWDGEMYQLAGTRYQMVARGQSSKSLLMERIEASLTDTQVFRVLDLGGTPTLHFTHRNTDTWGNMGVLLILGNGEDVISDYHCGDEMFSSIIDSIHARLNAGELL